MVSLHELVCYADGLLDSARFDDYCPNGLQVEGRPEVRTLVSGVTASQALLEAALEAGADAVLVHHGYFWKGEEPRVTGIRRTRLTTLLAHEVSLLAYHLPLDAHPELGNNAQLALRLGLRPEGWFARSGGPAIACHGVLRRPADGAELAARIAQALGRAPLHVPGRARPVRTMGWCTGAAQSYLEAAVALGLDAYLTGEVSEATVHLARESGVHFFAAGHHATERYGVQALGEHLARRFGLQHRFVDIDNPA